MWVGDLEANGLLDTATVIHCGVFKNLDTEEVVKFTPATIHRLLPWMDQCGTVIMHNGIDYDFPLMQKVLGRKPKCKLIDTLILSRLLNPKRDGNSVEAWGKRFGRHKVEHDDWTTYSDHMLFRCAEDVEIQVMIYNTLKEEERMQGGWEDAPYYPMRMTMKLFTILQEMKTYGWLFDVPYANECCTRLRNIMDSSGRRIAERLPLRCFTYETRAAQEKNYWLPLESIGLGHVGNNGLPNFNYVKKPFLKGGGYGRSVTAWWPEGDYPNIKGPFSRIVFRRLSLDSSSEIKPYLLSIGWKPSEWNTNDKGERTSPKLSLTDPFEGLTGGIGKLISKRFQCKQRLAMLEGLLKAVRPDGRISSEVKQLASTYRARHATVVNIPGSESFFGKELRRCFIAKDGYKIVGTDSAGCQNRMLAAHVDDEFFTKTLLEGKKSDHTSIHYVNQKAIKDVAGLDVSYHQSKTLNYATLFGGSANKVGSIVGGSASDGEMIKKAIFGVAPGFQQLIDDITAEWKKNARRRMNKWNKLEYFGGWIRALDGRPLFIEQEHTLLVYLLQSDEAIMMSVAMCKLYDDATRAFGPHGGRWGFVTWMHDEFQAEVQENIAEEFAKLAENSIVWAGEFYKIKCPHKGESDIGNNWHETH